MKKTFTWIRLHPIFTAGIALVVLLVGAIAAVWIIGAPYRKGLVFEGIPSSLGRN